MPETITITRVGLTVELLLHHRHGVRGRELVSKTLDSNPGLSALDAELPMGTVLTLPDLPAPAAGTVRVVTLFRVM